MKPSEAFLNYATEEGFWPNDNCQRWHKEIELLEELERHTRTLLKEYWWGYDDAKSVIAKLDALRGEFQHEKIGMIDSKAKDGMILRQAETIRLLQNKLDRYTRRSESGESLGDLYDAFDEIERLRAELATCQKKLTLAEKSVKLARLWLEHPEYESLEVRTAREVLENYEAGR